MREEQLKLPENKMKRILPLTNMIPMTPSANKNQQSRWIKITLMPFKNPVQLFLKANNNHNNKLLLPQKLSQFSSNPIKKTLS